MSKHNATMTIKNTAKKRNDVQSVNECTFNWLREEKPTTIADNPKKWLPVLLL